jgi:hypothetical protein
MLDYSCARQVHRLHRAATAAAVRSLASRMASTASLNDAGAPSTGHDVVPHRVRDGKLLLSHSLKMVMEHTMTTRRTLLLACAALAIAMPLRAQDKATEASLREAVKRYVAAWNSHDVQAWSSFLTDDIWYTEAIDYYQRMKGRQAVLAFFGDTVKTSDLVWVVERSHPYRQPRPLNGYGSR